MTYEHGGLMLAHSVCFQWGLSAVQQTFYFCLELLLSSADLQFRCSTT